MQALADLTSARWTLATPVWDFRLAAAETLVTLADRRTEPLFAVLKQRLADDANALQAVTAFEQQLADKLKAQ